MTGSVFKEFSVSNRVKQGCVLAPTLFSLYLSAMLEMAFKDTSEKVFVQTRKEADLLNVVQLKAKSKTLTKVVREMLFVVDGALVAHSVEDVQSLEEEFVRAVSPFGLNINIKKTEYLYRQSSSYQCHYQKKRLYRTISQVQDFQVPRSTVSKNTRLSDEFPLRIGMVSAVFRNWGKTVEKPTFNEPKVAQSC